MWSILLLVQQPAGEKIDLLALAQECPNGDADEIVICKKRDDGEPYRLKPLPVPAGKTRIAGPGLGFKLTPSARANVYGETVGLEGGGGQSTRAMVRLTIDF